MVAVAKNPPANAGDARDKHLIPGSGRSPAGGSGSPLQCSCQENPTDRGACQAIVHGVAKNQTRLYTYTNSTEDKDGSRETNQEATAMV